MVRIFAILTVSLALLSGCSDHTDNAGTPQAQYDFSAVNAAFQTFLDESAVLEGVSVTLVDAEQGTVLEAAFGDHDLDIVVLLASTSKMPTATLLMAIHDDDSLDFDIETRIDTYLPWDGVYGDRTTAQLVSNISGIPGLFSDATFGPYFCQLQPSTTLQECVEIIYTTAVPGTSPPGTLFDYGGAQWQIAGAVAEHVTNSSWNQAFDEYLAVPCELEVFTYGNPYLLQDEWTGHPDSLVGKDNPHLEGGAISNMRDYAKILLMHLRGGRCGDNQVLSPESVAFMQQDKAGDLGTNYSMGWWITPGDGETNTLFFDPGLFGAISWLDPERGIGGYVGIDNYSDSGSGSIQTLVRNVIIPMQQAAVDEARLAAAIN